MWKRKAIENLCERTGGHKWYILRMKHVDFPVLPELVFKCDTCGKKYTTNPFSMTEEERDAYRVWKKNHRQAEKRVYLQTETPDERN
jgi:hypothetical protein